MMEGEMRTYTNKILDLVDDGLYGRLDQAARDLIASLLMYMSEDDVKQFWIDYGMDDPFGEAEFFGEEDETP
jgi:hypothetical protein